MLRRIGGKGYRLAVRCLDHDLSVFRARIRRASGTEDIPSVVKGNLHHDSDVHAVFLIWQPSETPWYIDNALASLAEARVNVTVVVNHDLTPDRRAALLARASRLMLRSNAGFDIGGFRDAILSFREATPRRLIIMNDSVYYFKKGLTKLFRELSESTCDICGTYENFEIHYHVQSFCYSISGELMASPAFQEFWRRYLPVNSRLWAINRGEVGSSVVMLRNARSIDVLFTPSRLRKALAELDLEGLVDLSEYLPVDLRHAIRDVRPRRAIATTAILDAIASRSQIHTGGFIYRRFLGAPMMKRDLVYRSQYPLHEVEARLQELGAEGREREILADMRKRGAGALLRGRARVRFSLGL